MKRKKIKFMINNIFYFLFFIFYKKNTLKLLRRKIN